MRKRGQATLEAVTSILAFLTLLCAGIEGGRLFQAWVTVRHSCRVVADTVATGQGVTGPDVFTSDAETKRYPNAAGRWRCEAIKTAATRAIAGLSRFTVGGSDNFRVELRYCRDAFNDDRTQATIESCLRAAPAERATWPQGPGGPCDVVWVRNRYLYKPLFGSFIMGAGAATCGKELSCQELVQNADFGPGGCDFTSDADSYLDCFR